MRPVFEHGLTGILLDNNGNVSVHGAGFINVVVIDSKNKWGDFVRPSAAAKNRPVSHAIGFRDFIRAQIVCS